MNFGARIILNKFWCYNSQVEAEKAILKGTNIKFKKPCRGFLEEGCRDLWLRKSLEKLIGVYSNFSFEMSIIKFFIMEKYVWFQWHFHGFIKLFTFQIFNVFPLVIVAFFHKMCWQSYFISCKDIFWV